MTTEGTFQKCTKCKEKLICCQLFDKLNPPSLSEEEVMAAFNNIIKDYPSLKIFNWGMERDGVYCLEIYSKEGDKSFAVKELKKLYPEYISFAFGDQLNDIPMLKEADAGVAVKNARVEVKEIADYVTEDDVDNLGVLKFLERIIG